MHRISTVLQHYVGLLTQKPIWHQWRIPQILLLSVVVVWFAVTFRLAQPRPYDLPLPDYAADIVALDAPAVDTSLRWLSLDERIVPTVVTNLPTNIRLALTKYLFPKTEYIHYRTILAIPYTNTPVDVRMVWREQHEQLAQISIPTTPTRVYHVIAPLESADDITFHFSIAEVRTKLRADNREFGDDDIGIALISLTSQPLISTPLLTLLVVIIQGLITFGLSYATVRVFSLTTVSRTTALLFGLTSTTLVSVYEFVSGLPQSTIVWWVFVCSMALITMMRLVDVPARLPLHMVIVSMATLIIGAIWWYAPYATNGCLRTTIPPREWCSMTYLDYWIRPLHIILQLPDLVFPSISGIKYSDITPLPSEIQLWASVVVFALTSAFVKLVRGWHTHMPISITITIAGASLITMGLPGMFPGMLWMNVLEPTAYGTWQTWIAGVADMRIPVSPFILAIEGWLIQSPFGFGFYKWILFRVMLVGVLTLVIFHQKQTTLHWWLVGVGLLFVTCFTAYYTHMYAARYIAYIVFSYDILLIFTLVLMMHILRVPHLKVWHVVVVGVLLAIADNTRPYMMLFTPVIATLVGWHVIRRHTPRLLVFLCIPLIPIVLWHAYHLIALQQTTWSNHTGYNLCNAWPCPNQVVLQPEAPPRSANRSINLNTALHTQNSQQLTKALIEYNQHDPLRAVVRGAKLVLYSITMPSPHATSISQARHPDVLDQHAEWHAWSADAWLDIVLDDVLWPPHPLPTMVLVGNALMRILFATLFIMQGICVVLLIGRLWRRRHTTPLLRRLPPTLAWHGVYALILLGMYVVSSISEFGENYRWVAMMGIAAFYLPYTHIYRFITTPKRTTVAQ